MFGRLGRTAAKCALAAAIASGPVGAGAAPVQLTLACLDVAQALEACRVGAATFAERTGHDVRVVTAEAQDRVSLERYQALFTVGSSRLDVVQFPLAWHYALAEWLAPVQRQVPREAFVGKIGAAGAVGDLYTVLPHHLAVTMLYLRADVLTERPSDWAALQEELVDAPVDSPGGLALAGAGAALFPFFLDFLASLSVETLEDRAGVERALEILEQGVGSLASRDIAAVDPRAAREEFASGRSAGLLGRSTEQPLLERSPIGDHLETMVRPADVGVTSSSLVATIWALGVSRHSRHSGAAAELANYLVSPEMQRRNAMEYKLAPTLEALYDDPDVAATSPVLARIAERTADIVSVPVERYREGYLGLSDSVADAVRAVIRDDIEPDEGAERISESARAARLQIE